MPTPFARARLPVFLATIAVCFYIGYFGAGAGFLLITLLSLFGFQDLNEINALKVVSTTLANGIAFLIFVVRRPGGMALLPAGHGHLRDRRLHLGQHGPPVPQPVLRGLVVFIGLSMAAWFFWKG